jgi:hypothetical protein
MPNLSELDPSKIKLISPGETKTRPSSVRDLDLSKVNVVQFAPSYLESAGYGAAQGATLGFSDEILGGIQGAYDYATRQNSDFGDAYTKRRDAWRDAQKSAQEANPYTYGAGEFAGNLGSMLIPGLGVANVTGKTGLALAKGLAATGAKGGALYGLGASEADNVYDMAKDTVVGGVLGGAAGVAVPYGLKGAVGLAKATGNAAGDLIAASGPVARRVGSLIAKVDDDKALRYLSRRDAVNAVDEGKLVDDVADQIGQYKDKFLDKKQAVRDFVTEKKKADRALKESLQKAGVRQETVEQAQGALDDLRGRVSEGSTRSYDALIAADKRFNIDPIKGQMTNALDEFKINGVEPPRGVPGYDKLQYYREYLDELTGSSKDISAVDLKKFLGFVDDDIGVIYQKQRIEPGYKPSKAERSLIDFRAGVSETLKEIPEFREIMLGVSEDASLLSEAQRFFGGSRARSTLEKLSDPKNIRAREALGRVDDKTGRNILGDLSQYEEAQRLLRDPDLLRQAQAALPETFDLRAAERSLGDAAAEFAPVRSAGNPQNLVRRGANPTNLKEQKIIEYLDSKRAPGQELVREGIDDLATQRAFQQDQSGGRGHRWAVTGGVAGAVIGGPFGATTGAGIGAAVDRYGGRAFKGGLDLFLDGGKNIAGNLMKFVREKPERLGRFAQPLIKAAERGPSAVGAAHFVLYKNNPEYRKLLGGEAEEAYETGLGVAGAIGNEL